MNIYMIGIGGIGMSALAQLYARDGNDVTGSDRDVSPTTKLLEQKGVQVSIGQKAENLPGHIDLVVYSDAIHDDNPEWVEAKKRGITMRSYFEALGDVSQDRKTAAVAGTHGKTTTTAMLAKILEDSGDDPTAIIGSLVPEFGSNFLPGEGYFVVEACEYKDHLLKLSPEVLVITNLEWDHTDWFTTFEAMQETFRKAIERVPGHGTIVTNPHDPNIAPLLPSAKAAVVDYTKEEVPKLALIGAFNRMNAQAAKAAAKIVSPELREEDIDDSLSLFKGTWRRFEKKGEMRGGALVYDDYAHHPTAVRKTLEAVREHFPDNKIIVAFHPHLYSRTRDLMDEFATSFKAADEVIIAPIYPAREASIPGVTSAVLAEKIDAHGGKAVAVASLDDVEEALREFDRPDTVIITMGAGDIYKVAERLV